MTTPIMVGKTSCKLLCAIEVKVCNKYVGSSAKRWPRVTTPIMVGKTSCKLLCAIEVKVCNKYVGSLAINFLALADIKASSL